MQSTCVEREPVVRAVARLIAEQRDRSGGSAPLTLADIVHINLAEGWTFELPNGAAADGPLRAAGLRLHDADLMRAWEQAQQLTGASNGARGRSSYPLAS
jgi:hypothetical protein